MSMGIGIVLLIVCSFVLLVVIFERLLVLRYAFQGRDRFLDLVGAALSAGKINEALSFSQAMPGCYPRVFHEALSRHVRTVNPALTREALAARLTEEQLFLERNTQVVGTIAVVAPFLGLFGTVIGIIRSFQAIAQQGSMASTALSAGIAEALYSTALGLFVAIIAVAFFNLFKFAVRARMVEMENAASRLMEGLSGEGLPG